MIHPGVGRRSTPSRLGAIGTRIGYHEDRPSGW